MIVADGTMSASKAWFDRIICAWSIVSGHCFTEAELDSLVDALDMNNRTRRAVKRRKEKRMTETTTAATVFQNIANLLRVGQFQGQHGQMVFDAITFLEKVVADDKAKQEAPVAEPTPAQ